MSDACAASSALLRKELRTYFGSPLVYLVAAAFLAYTGYYFHSDLIYFVTFGFGFSIMENFWQLVFIDVRLVLMLAIPLLTMRLLAEERRLGTLELLLTYPRRATASSWRRSSARACWSSRCCSPARSCTRAAV